MDRSSDHDRTKNTEGERSPRRPRTAQQGSTRSVSPRRCESGGGEEEGERKEPELQMDVVKLGMTGHL